MSWVWSSLSPRCVRSARRHRARIGRAIYGRGRGDGQGGGVDVPERVDEQGGHAADQHATPADSVSALASVARWLIGGRPGRGTGVVAVGGRCGRDADILKVGEEGRPLRLLTSPLDGVGTAAPSSGATRAPSPAGTPRRCPGRPAVTGGGGRIPSRVRGVGHPHVLEEGTWTSAGLVEDGRQRSAQLFVLADHGVVGAGDDQAAVPGGECGEPVALLRGEGGGAERL